MTIIDALSKTGGLMGIVIGVFEVLVRMIHKVELFSVLVSEHFLFKNPKKSLKKYSKELE